MAEEIQAERKKPKMVMVAIDESESSYNALAWVLDNLKETICSSSSSSSTNTSLVLFSPQPLIVPGFFNSASLGSARLYFHGPSVTNPAQDQSRKVSLSLLKKAKEICAGQGVNVETIIETGDPKIAICSAVQKYKIDLFIVGCEGYGPLKRILMGSTSDYCLKNVKCSVLVVRKPKQ